MVTGGAAGHGGPLGTETRLWLLVVCAFVVGDVVTTLAGLSTPGVREASPLLADAVHRHGGLALVGGKISVLAGAVPAWWVTRSPYRWGIPVGLSVLGIAVTGWNTVVVAVAALG